MNTAQIADRETPDTQHLCDRVRSMVDPEADLDAICEGFLAGIKAGWTYNEHAPQPDATINEGRRASRTTATGEEKFPTEWTLYP